jgi:putative flippase GtrA
MRHRLQHVRFLFTTPELAGQIARFLLVGFCNFALTFLIYLPCLLVFNPVISIMLASIAGLIFTSILNIDVVFRKRIELRLLLIMAASYVAFFAAYAVLLDLVILHFAVPAPLAPLPVACVLVPVQFFCTKYLALQFGRVTYEMPQ